MANGTLKVSNIETSSGSGTITLGASGETVDLSTATMTLNSSMKNTPAFSSYMSGDFSASNASWTKLQINSEYYDTDSAFDTSNYRFVVPSGKAGKYFFAAKTACPGVDDQEDFAISFYKNGSRVEQTDVGVFSPKTDATLFASTSYSWDLSVGDYIEVYIYQTSGDAQNIDASFTNFLGYRIIGA